MEFKLTEEQKDIVDLAKEFANEVFTDEFIEESEANVGHFPKEIYAQMVEAGFMGITFGEQYGGSDLGYVTFTMAMEELAKISPSAATTLLISLLPLEAIAIFGTQEQKDKWITESVNNPECRGSMAFTEPSTGSDPKQLKTTAKLVGDTWVINGVKRFISNAQYGGPMLVYANVDGDPKKCTAFLFEKHKEDGTPVDGYSISTPWKKIGLKGSACYDVFFDDVKVPNTPEHILGNIGDGMPILKATTAYGKLGFSAVFLGALGGAHDKAKKYAIEKVHRDGNITKFQAVQMKYVNLLAKYESCRYLVYKCGEMANDAHADHKLLNKMAGEAALVKAYVGDTAVEGCVLAMNIMGSYGVMDEYKVENFLRDALIGPHVEGQTDVQRVIAASYYLK